jgi:signal transduction histidine kinase/DNA-binding NarL/FixJ family response regulator/HPt (histidine-containing phosphotransfer) domain-containing protein
MTAPFPDVRAEDERGPRGARSVPSDRDREAFQRVLMDLAVGFVNSPLDTIDQDIDRALARIGRFTGADRAYVFAYDFPRGITVNTHEWCAPGVEAVRDELQALPLDGIDRWVETHRAGLPMHVPSVPALDPRDQLRRILEPQGVITLITVPMLYEGECLGFVGFDAVHAVKDWTADEIALLKVLAELLANAHLRRDRERELVSARHAAEEATRVKSRFMATISHELRTPMHGVLGMAELLTDTDLDPTQRRSVLAIQRSGATLQRLLDDVLDLARIEAGRLELRPAPFDPTSLLREIAELTAPAASAAGLALEVEVAADVPDRIHGDATRLRQILWNLVSNAVRYTEQGMVRLRLQAAAADPGSARLRWEVADTGPGLDPSALPQAFEPFVQLRGGTVPQHGGTGLGLTIVRELVELMGGDLEVDGRPGQGTSFLVSLTFPIVTDRTERATPTMPPSVGRGWRVLVVDDDEVSLSVARAHLAALGCTAVTAVDGEQALELLAARQVELLLIDQRLPTIDGLEVARRIRAAEPADRHLPIVAVTAAVMNSGEDAYLDAGVDAVLPKPYTRAELADIVASVVDEAPADRPSPVAAAAGDVSADAGRREPADLDPHVLDGLASGGHADAELPRRLLDLFWRDAEEQLAQLAAAARTGDTDRLAAAAHRLRSSSAAVGATRLAATAADLEGSVAAGAAEGARDALLTAINDAFEAARWAGARFLSERERQAAAGAAEVG